ncbi:unnamed protein product [Arabidopsis arenosa]|uniref:Uncharacterized protein n=1 Tax=Arabidopsis arenosa TaxID=38785 RepID=A0A8S2ABI9_ARAAE|nr:unnamed protein product [Arabidopsis arenosa]
MEITEEIARVDLTRGDFSLSNFLPLLITISCAAVGFSVDSGDDEDPEAHGSSSVTCCSYHANQSGQNQGSSGGEKLLPDNDGKSSTGVVAMRSGRRRSTVRNERGKQLVLGTGDYGGLTGSLSIGEVDSDPAKLSHRRQSLFLLPTVSLSHDRAKISSTKSRSDLFLLLNTALRWRDGNGSWITISFGLRRPGSPEVLFRRESAVLDGGFYQVL